jgi:hypothetical protein
MRASCVASIRSVQCLARAQAFNGLERNLGFDFPLNVA